MIDNPEVVKILAEFEKLGLGAAVPPDQIETVINHLLKGINALGYPDADAVAMIRLIQWGSWSVGWDKGYSTGRGKERARIDDATT